MRHGLLTGVFLTLALLLGPLSTPARACVAYSGFDPQKPFTDHYLEEPWTIFRGRPVDFQLLSAEQGHSPWVAEISFAVIESYRGQLDEMVRILWFVDPILQSRDLDEFRTEVGEDIVAVLMEPFSLSLRVSQLRPIAVNSCLESATRRYEVMEPVLRERGLIN
jgi:hypothetical protein